MDMYIYQCSHVYRHLDGGIDFKDDEINPICTSINVATSINVHNRNATGCAENRCSGSTASHGGERCCPVAWGMGGGVRMGEAGGRGRGREGGREREREGQRAGGEERGDEGFN